MDRRTFFSGLAALGLLPAISLGAKEKSTAKLKITAVELWRLHGDRYVGYEEYINAKTEPMYIYEDRIPVPYPPVYKTEKTNRRISANYLIIKTSEGIEGIYGPVDNEAAVVVDRQLKNFLIGKNPLAIETLWDQMKRLNRHSRSGHFMMGISAVNNALWDLAGRYYKTPVYQLLGGPSRDAVDAYASCLGFSAAPDALRKKSAELKNQGYKYQKWFMPYGPGHGSDGLIKNVEIVRILRETLGDAYELMFDAFMGWDLEYAVAWAKQVEQYRPRWIEEAFPPDRMESFVRLSQSTTVPVATGEHIYNRWEVHELLKQNAITVVQTDPEWCGGVSELVKICTLASVYGAQVVPHGHNLHTALHVIASQPPDVCPCMEYLITKMRSYYYFEKHQLTPVNGKIALPDRPGFGIELDESKITDKKLLTWE